MSDNQTPPKTSPLNGVWASDLGPLMPPDWIDPSLSVTDQLAHQLKNLLDCVEVYGRDYMHGEARKHHVRRARKALAQYKDTQA